MEMTLIMYLRYGNGEDMYIHFFINKSNVSTLLK